MLRRLLLKVRERQTLVPTSDFISLRIAWANRLPARTGLRGFHSFWKKGSFICGEMRIIGRKQRASRSAGSVKDWKHHQAMARKGLHPSKWTGSLAPHWDPDVHVEAGYGHGNVTHTWGRTWKWQQVSKGVSIGIPIEDWDDNIHRKSDQFVAWTDNPEDYGQNPGNPTLEARANGPQWNHGLCRALISCGRQYLGGS